MVRGGSSPLERMEAEYCYLDSSYGRELPLDLAIHRALEADKQLLVQHSGNPLQYRQLRMCMPFSSRDTAL